MSSAAGTPRPRVLVVDDQVALAETLCEGLEDLGYDAVAMASGDEAARLLGVEPFDALVTDLRMPGTDGLALLAIARRVAPELPVIVMTAFSAVDSAVESIRQGAFHYLTKPFKVGELALFLDKALERTRLTKETRTLRRALRQSFGLGNLIVASPAMQAVADLVTRVADAAAPVLVLGETGTGKGVVARAIHAQGRRAERPFVAVNCAALPETLLESELFGHVKGAFTGATQSRVGLLQDASTGTLFLDEIAEMSPALQAKLLHVIESGTVRPVGSNQERHVDVRIIAATHRNLRDRVADGQFREDLLYRLDVITIELPALRHRTADIPALVQRFLAEARERNGSSPAERLSADAQARLLAHDWPGNVRELRHVVERAVILARGPEIGAADLPASVTAALTAPGNATFRGPVVPLREVQRLYAAWAYEQLGGRKVMTAEALDVDFRTLAKLLDPK
ncbi:MAG: Response regulator of zinc sigma-54-dependent two-component system [Labilithrix sp.]|nr:Response regulator of zinc sigma-54-dependent two-component system [Labilithrix sp.]